MISGGAVFTSVQQALHFSFLIEDMPATSKSQMQVLLDHLLEMSGRQVEEVLDPRERRIDFGGLNALEVRGQCALVVAAVNTHLAQPERAAVWTRHGRRQRQAEGVAQLADYVAPMLITHHPDAHKAMIWGKYGRFDLGRAARRVTRDDFSTRKIAEEFGLHYKTVNRDQLRIVSCHRALEGRALQRLEPYFVRTELVGEYSTLQSP